MISKETIIDNVSEYSPNQLVDYIRKGTVSYEELCEEPDFSALVRKQVQELLANFEKDDWQNARAINTIEEYDQYLKSYPEGTHRSEAREAKKRLIEQTSIDISEKAWNELDKEDSASLESFISSFPESSHIQEARAKKSNLSRRRYTASAIKRLKQDIDGEKNPEFVVDTIKEYLSNGSVTTDQLYEEIHKNHNFLVSKVIDRLEEDGFIDFLELERAASIDSRFLEFITNNDVNSPVMSVEANPINSIGPKTTEVYFWGIPSSGKTCALGAIMNEARHGGYVDFAEPNNKCQGLHYMTMLSQIFEGGSEVFKLPEGTQTDAIFEMGYILKKNKMDYPVTFIDLAGETIESMYRKNAQLQLNPKKQMGLDMAFKLLTGNAGINRKIHFFVLEYNGHTKKYKDLTQDTLLTGAMTFIKDTGIFNTETDAVYLLVTKSDLTGSDSEDERNAVLAKYLKDHYSQFYNGLRSICAENEINEGNVDIVPFSLGDVCFQNLCLFDKSTASTVVELIMNRAKGFKSGKIVNLFNKFKK